MLKQVLIVSLLCLAYGDGSPLISPDMENNEELLQYTHVALYMVKRFIAQRTNTLVIMEKCSFFCEDHHKYHLVLLQNFLHNINHTISIQLFFGKRDDRPWDYNLFVVDSWWTFEALRFRFPVTQHERQFYFFILLTWSVPGSSRSLQFQMLRIFDMCLRFSVKNVIIMNQAVNRRHISFYTYQIYGPQHCQERMTIHEVNRYENGQLQHDFLFPDTTFNFHGCTLTVSANIGDPLLTFRGDITNARHLKEMQRLGGIEGEILKLAAETMNLNLQYRFPRALNVLKLYTNDTEWFDDLEQGYAQLAIGSLSPILPNSHKFTYSFVYHTTPYVFVVREGLLFGPIKQLLNPLNQGTWLAVLIFWLIAIAVIEVLERLHPPLMRNFVFGPSNQYPIRNMLVVFLGITLPTNTIPKRNFSRFLLMAWLLLTFELRNGYQGKMFDSLRLAKRIPIPQKISELIDGDYTLLTHIPNDFFPSNKTKIIHGPSKRFHILNTSEERLTATSLLDHLRIYNMKNWNSSSLTYVDENIYFYQCAIFFPKHSIVSESFNRKLKLISDAGITANIAKRHVHWQKRKANGPSQSPGVARITNRNLRGLYTIYGILCEVSISFFVLELLAKKSRKLKKFMDWLN